MATPRLLVVRNSGVGDLLMAVPALRALKRAFPDHQLVTTCPTWLEPLASHLKLAVEVVDESLVSPTDGSDAVASPVYHQQADKLILSKLTEGGGGFDVVVALRVPRKELIGRLLSMRPRVYMGFRHEEVPATAHMPRFDESAHILRRWQRMLEAFELSVDSRDLYTEQTEEYVSGSSEKVILHVGAASQSRQWPADRWADVARTLSERGCRIVLTGSSAERDLVARVRAMAGLEESADLSGRTGIVELFDLVRQARLVISGDTGTSHMATVLRRRSLTLFGPVPPSCWGPPPGSRIHRTLWTGQVGDAYGPVPHPGLLEISTEDVIETVTSEGWA